MHGGPAIEGQRATEGGPARWTACVQGGPVAGCYVWPASGIEQAAVIRRGSDYLGALEPKRVLGRRRQSPRRPLGHAGRPGDGVPALFLQPATVVRVRCPSPYAASGKVRHQPARARRLSTSPARVVSGTPSVQTGTHTAISSPPAPTHPQPNSQFQPAHRISSSSTTSSRLHFNL
jgi:hypothetical protein